MLAQRRPQLMKPLWHCMQALPVADRWTAASSLPRGRAGRRPSSSRTSNPQYQLASKLGDTFVDSVAWQDAKTRARKGNRRVWRRVLRRQSTRRDRPNARAAPRPAPASAPGIPNSMFPASAPTPPRAATTRAVRRVGDMDPSGPVDGIGSVAPVDGPLVKGLPAGGRTVPRGGGGGAAIPFITRGLDPQSVAGNSTLLRRPFMASRLARMAPAARYAAAMVFVGVFQDLYGRLRWSSSAVAALVLLSALVVTGQSPAATPVVPGEAQFAGAPAAQSQTTLSRRVAAWQVYWASDEGWESFDPNATLFSELSPFAFQISKRGRIATFSGALDPDTIMSARENGVLIVPTISNSFDAKRIHRMVSKKSRRRRHVRALKRLVLRNGYDGIDIDYENVAIRDRALFTKFITELAAALHSQGKVLSVTVMAKTSAVGGSSGAQATDYRAIGAVADRVRVMAYDYHWSGGSAGPVAPAFWVDRVVAYTVTEIPAWKVQLGIPLYGYVWRRGRRGSAQSVTWKQATALARRNKVRVRWSATAQTPWFRYGGPRKRRRVVWFENRRSLAVKAGIADRYGLGGVVFWRLGGEPSTLWSDLEQRWGAETATS